MRAPLRFALLFCFRYVYKWHKDPACPGRSRLAADAHRVSPAVGAFSRLAVTLVGVAVYHCSVPTCRKRQEKRRERKKKTNRKKKLVDYKWAHIYTGASEYSKGLDVYHLVGDELWDLGAEYTNCSLVHFSIR